MKFVNEDNIKNSKYEEYPFPYTVIDNFFNEEEVSNILYNLNNLKDIDAQCQFVNPYNPYEYNKFAWDKNYGEYLEGIFRELNSPEFIKYLEDLTGIKGIITNDIGLRGAGIHRIKSGGHLQLHTDFNSYHNEYGKLDRRINLLVYMNPWWRDEYNGSLCLLDKDKQICVKKISPILNRCVIFNTSNKSVHGHPELLNTPEHIYRQSIAVYYYTKNTNGLCDFEGDQEHSTIWYSSLKT